MGFLLIISSLFWSACSWNLFRPTPEGRCHGQLLAGAHNRRTGTFSSCQVLLAGLMINAGAITGTWTSLALLAWFIAGIAQLIYLVNSSLSGQALRQVLDIHEIPQISTSEAEQQRKRFWPRVQTFAIRLKEVHCEKDVVYCTADGETLTLDIYQKPSRTINHRRRYSFTFTVAAYLNMAAQKRGKDCRCSMNSLSEGGSVFQLTTA